MPSSFDLAIPYTLKHEGGYANNSNDPGGATDYGISIRWLAAQGHNIGDFTHDGTVDINDIKKMTQADAVNLYRTYWWDKFGFSKFDFQPLATKTFDGAVNMGTAQAVKHLQRSLVALGNLRLVPDGKLGPETFQTANAVTSSNGDNAFQLMAQFAFTEQSFYNKLAADHAPKFDGFLKGWTLRASEIYMPVR